MWVVRNPLERGAYRGFLSFPVSGRAWRWMFCPECNMAAENPEYAAQREPIEDKNGHVLSEGDIVEFYFNAWPEMGEPTRMVDVVERHNGWLYFIHPELRRGAIATEHALHCTRLGSIDGLDNNNLQIRLGVVEYGNITKYLKQADA